MPHNCDDEQIAVASAADAVLQKNLELNTANAVYDAAVIALENCLDSSSLSTSSTSTSSTSS